MAYIAAARTAYTAYSIGKAGGLFGGGGGKRRLPWGFTSYHRFGAASTEIRLRVQAREDKLRKELIGVGLTGEGAELKKLFDAQGVAHSPAHLVQQIGEQENILEYYTDVLKDFSGQTKEKQTEILSSTGRNIYDESTKATVAKKTLTGEVSETKEEEARKATKKRKGAPRQRGRLFRNIFTLTGGSPSRRRVLGN